MMGALSNLLYHNCQQICRQKKYINIFTLKYQLSKIHLCVVVCKTGKRKKAPPLDKVVVTDRVQWVHARMATTWDSAMLGISSRGEVSSSRGPQASWARWTNLLNYIYINTFRFWWRSCWGALLWKSFTFSLGQRRERRQKLDSRICSSAKYLTSK